jgi:hypothetical protein
MTGTHRSLANYLRKPRPALWRTSPYWMLWITLGAILCLFGGASQLRHRPLLAVLLLCIGFSIVATALAYAVRPVRERDRLRRFRNRR